jgi:hypothetical protein
VARVSVLVGADTDSTEKLGAFLVPQQSHRCLALTPASLCVILGVANPNNSKEWFCGICVRPYERPRVRVPTGFGGCG